MGRINSNRIFRCAGFVIVFALLCALAAAPAFSQSDDKDKPLDVRSSVGDLHVGNDADMRAIGLPAYPGARIRKDEDHSNANLALFTSAFGVKLLVMHFDSDDTPARVASFYRDKLKRYGKVLECHTSHGDHVQVHDGGDDSHHAKELSCDGDNTGPVLELKAGTEDDQHAVAVEPAEKGNGATFAVVFVRARGKQGDI